MAAEVLFEMRGSVLVVTFDRSDKGNAFTAYMAKMMYDKMRQVSEDRGVRAVVLRGNGPHFMDGHDLNAYVGDINALQDQIHQKVQFFYTAIRELQAMEKPVIAALHGRVSGAGVAFAAAADLAFAGQGAVLNGGFTQYAMVPDGGAAFFLARKIGLARANELLFLNEDVSAEKAEKWGLVNRVVADADLDAAVLAAADRLANGATRALAGAKKLVAQACERDLGAHLGVEAALWNASVKTFDFREAMKAFSAKRPPKFMGA